MTTLSKGKLKRILTQAGYPDADMFPEPFHAIWQAAQAEQRERDAGICMKNHMSRGIDCAAAIRNQEDGE